MDQERGKVVTQRKSKSMVPRKGGMAFEPSNTIATSWCKITLALEF